MAIKDFENFTVSELSEIIADTILTDEDREIAKLRYIKLLPYEKIAEKLGIDKRTIYTRVRTIKYKIEKTILFNSKEDGH